MTQPTPAPPDAHAPGAAPTEADTARDPDAVAGLAMVAARVARCTPAEQAAFWAAVRRCFGGPPESAGA